MVTDDKQRATSVLIVGVGGQGVILVSKALALLSQRAGHEVKQSEVHGMAKRGGAVFSHVRYGARVWSPPNPVGEADVLVALEWAEALRWLNYLNPQTGTLIADTRKIIPPFACLKRGRNVVPTYARSTPAEIVGKVQTGYALDATGIASRQGSERTSNVVLLGVLSRVLDFALEDWLDVVAECVPAKTLEINRKAFLEGRAWVDHATVPQAEAEAPHPAAGDGPDMRAELEIVPQWCKGCDICVRMCPEHCLVLNREQRVEIARPEACTGCRICEWLCPDFAIRVHNVPVMAASVLELVAES
jgi:indolepyruvate ferredoxin oxidoreductase beta subunit